jgi:WD40 repeat protein
MMVLVVVLRGRPQRTMSQSVFISYAREDDEPFAKRLHKDLTRSGFKVWWDRASLRTRQLPFRQEIADAIRSHDRLILIVGPKAAVSASVRQEWQWALALDKPVIPILRKGDYTHLPGELSAIQCDDFRNDAQYPAQLARLIESLRRPEPPLGGLFGVPSLPPHFLARPDLLSQVKDALLRDLKAPVVITGADAHVGVHGMGGIGKSVLGAAIARDREVRRSYPDGIIWLTVGQQPDLVQLQHDVGHHLGRKEHFDTEPQGQGVLRQLLAQRAVLLILDDVWKTSDTQAFDVLGPRCRALVTTRDTGILHTLGGPSVPVSLLAEGEARQLLSNAVGVEPSALPADALEVVKECGYLPLAIALCAGMAKAGHSWKDIVEALREADLEWPENRTEANQRHRTIWNAMKASYDVLPDSEKRRFAELAVFATDEIVPEAGVQTLWKHTGWMSRRNCTKLLISLAERSLIRLHQTTAKPGKAIQRGMSFHDLLYDFVTKVIGEPKRLQRRLLDAYRKRCPTGWHSGPDDGYLYQHLAHHLQQAERQQELKKLLFDYRWLRRKLEVTDANGLIADYSFAGDDLQARLIQDALRLSSHALAQDHSHLPSQLFSRLLSCKGARIRALLNDVGASESRPWLKPLLGALMPPGGPLLRTLVGHEDGVNAVGVTPDGRHVVSGSDDGTLKVWEIESGRVTQTLLGHELLVTGVAVTPDGLRVVSGSTDTTLKVWEIESGRLIRTFAGHEGGVNAVAVTPDGRHAISGSDDGTLKVWEIESGRVSQTLAGHEGEVSALAVTADGEYAVSGSWDRTLRVWELASGRMVRRLGHAGRVHALAVTPDKRHIVSGSDNGTLRVWDLATGRMIGKPLGHTTCVHAVAVAPDSRRAVSGSGDGTLKVWELAGGRVIETLKDHAGPVLTVAVTPDSRHVVSGSADGTLRVWEFASRRAVQTPTTHARCVRAEAVTSDARYVLSRSADQALEVWDLTSDESPQRLAGHACRVFALAVTPDGRYAVLASADPMLKLGEIASGQATMLRVWEFASGRAVHALAGHAGLVLAVAVTADGRHVVSGSEDKTLRVWELASGESLQTLAGHKGWILAVAVTPDGRYAVSGSTDKTLKVWELANGRAVRTLAGHEDLVRTVAVTPDGRYALSGSADKTLKVWELASGRVVQTLAGHESEVSTVAVTLRGRCAVSGSADRTLKVWDIKTGTVLASFAADAAIDSCAVAPGNLIVAREVSGRLHFLELENVKQRRCRSK